MHDFFQTPGARLLSINELAAALGISVRKAWKLIHIDPAFPAPRKIGARGTRFLSTDLDAYINGLKSR